MSAPRSQSGHVGRVHALPAPDTKPIGAPPAFLGREAKAEWKRVVKEVGSLLTPRDRSTMTRHCLAWAALVDAAKHIEKHSPVQKTPKGYQQVDAWWTVLQNADAALRDTSNRLGLDPSSRAAIAGKAGKKQKSSADRMRERMRERRAAEKKSS